MRRLFRAIVVSLLAVPIGYLLAFGATEVHVSGGPAADAFKKSTDFPLWKGLKRVPLLREPRAVWVKEVGVWDAVVNGVFSVCTISLMGLVMVPIFFVGLLAMIYGLVTAQWEAFLVGLLAAILMPLLLAIALPISACALWIMLLIQPATPAYVVLWIVLGLPFLLFGLAMAASGPAYTITGRDIIITRFVSGARYGVSGQDVSIRRS